MVEACAAAEVARTQRMASAEGMLRIMGKPLSSLRTK
jgi:hypothetical protein